MANVSAGRVTPPPSPPLGAAAKPSPVPLCRHCGERVPLEDMDRHQCAASGYAVAGQPARELSDGLLTTRRRRSRSRGASSSSTSESGSLSISSSTAATSLDPLGRLGYFIDAAGELRHVATSRHVKDEVALADFPEKRYAQLVEAISEYVQQRMISNHSSAFAATGGFERIMVPTAEEALSPEARCPIFATRGWRKARRLVVLISSARVRAGMWSRSMSIDHGIYFGSMLPYFKMARKTGEDMGIIVLNPYSNSTIQRDASSFAVKRNKTHVRLSETPERHVLYSWDRFIRHAGAACLFFVCNGYGGVLLQHLIMERDEARARISAIALTDSSHDWKAHERSLSGQSVSSSGSGKNTQGLDFVDDVGKGVVDSSPAKGTGDDGRRTPQRAMSPDYSTLFPEALESSTPMSSEGVGYVPSSSSPTFGRRMSLSPTPERTADETISIAKLVFKERAINWVFDVDALAKLARIRARVGCECISLSYTADDETRFKGDRNPGLVNTKAVEAIFAFFEWTAREGLVAPAHTFFRRRQLQLQKESQGTLMVHPTPIEVAESVPEAAGLVDVAAGVAFPPPSLRRFGASVDNIRLGRRKRDVGEDEKDAEILSALTKSHDEDTSTRELADPPRTAAAFVGVNSPLWVADNSVSECMICAAVNFGLLNRRHHCRSCGRVVCNGCSKTRVQSKRVCDECAENQGRHQSVKETLPPVSHDAHENPELSVASPTAFTAPTASSAQTASPPLSANPERTFMNVQSAPIEAYPSVESLLSELSASGLVDVGRALSEYEPYTERTSGTSSPVVISTSTSAPIKKPWSLGKFLNFGGAKSRDGKDAASAQDQAIEGFRSLYKYDGTVCLLYAIVLPEEDSSTIHSSPARALTIFRHEWEGITQRVSVQERLCPGSGRNALAMMPPCFSPIEAIFAAKEPGTGRSMVVVHERHVYPETRVSLRQWLTGDDDDGADVNRGGVASRNNISDIVKNNRPPWEIQSVVRQIFTGISTLHSVGIAHGTLSLDAIEITWDPDDIFETRTSQSITKQCTAMIHGLENSVDVRSRGATVRLPPRARTVSPEIDYVAPEVRAAKRATTDDQSGGFSTLPLQSMLAADMWSLGVIFLRALLGPNTEVVILDGTRVQLPVIHPNVTGLERRASLNGGGGRGTQNNAWWNRTRELLHSLLSLDPTSRPGSQQALWHPCFNVSIAADIVDDGNFVTQENKIRRLQNRVARMLMRDAQPWMMMVKRNPAPRLVQEALSQFYRRKKRIDMLRTMHVSFVGESGVDAGGLRKDLFQTLFERVTDAAHPLNLFEWRKDGRGCLPKGYTAGGAATSSEARSTQAARLRLFEGLGRALLKALIDQITIPCSTFAPSLFRFLLGRAGPGGMPLTDLEEFDPALARQLNDHILGTHIGDGSALGLDFTGLRGSRKSQDLAVSNSGRANRARTVMNRNRERIHSHEELSESNKREYVRLMVDKVLVQDRIRELEAMRRGFTTADLGEYLSNLTVPDLRMLLCGPEYITSDMVLDAIDFDYGDWVPPNGPLATQAMKMSRSQRGGGTSSMYVNDKESSESRWGWSSLIGGGAGHSAAAKGLKVLHDLQRYIESMDEPKLRQFLRFATGSSALSATFLDGGRGSGLGLLDGDVADGADGEASRPQKIKFQRLPKSERLPQAHTCFNLVELPAYARYETLKEKFDFALGGVEAAIGRE